METVPGGPVSNPAASPAQSAPPSAPAPVPSRPGSNPPAPHSAGGRHGALPGSPAVPQHSAADPPGPDPHRILWDEVDSNKWKSILLLAGFGVVIGLLGYVLGEFTQLGPVAPVLALTIAAFMAFTSYYYSDRIVLAASKATPVDRQKYPHLVNVVEGLSIAAGVPVPRIYTIDDTAPNAFATGRNPASSAIVVTTGLVEKLNRQELEGVIAHEMSHIRNYDIRMTTLAAVLVGSVALMSDWAMRSLRWGMWGGMGRATRRRGRDGSGAILVIAVVLLAILAPIAAQILQFALSRRREYLADSNGALLTRYPEGLASALEKIAADTEPLEVANRATAPLYIVNPLFDYQGRRVSLFDTHPPIQDRIRRLRSL